MKTAVFHENNKYSGPGRYIMFSVSPLTRPWIVSQ